MNDRARIFAIDESWINDVSGNSKTWVSQNSRNSRNIKGVSPRLSLIVAIDNFGSIYMALSQANTDHDVF